MEKIILSLLIITFLQPVPFPDYHSETEEVIHHLLPLTDKIIILDPGHGINNDNRFLGYSEQETMLALANRIGPKLEDLGATVHMTRSTPANVNNFARAAYINKVALNLLRDQLLLDIYAAEERERYILRGELDEIKRLTGILQKIIADPEHYAPIYMNKPFDFGYHNRVIHPDLRQVFLLQNNPLIYERLLAISLHSNASPSSYMHGADVYIISNRMPQLAIYFARYSHEERSALFGDILLDKISEAGLTRRSVINNKAFILLREHNVPAVLVENGFHTNARDRALLMDGNFLDRLALAYIEAILVYFNHR